MQIDEARSWLQWLYGEEPQGLLWIGGHADGFAGRTFTSISDALTYASELDASAAGGVYHRLTTMRAVEKGRGSAADSAYLPALAMDLDLQGPGHKALNYPEHELQLTTLLRKAGLPEPSAWVHSGGGRYPFWKLEQPLDLTLPGELERAAILSRELHRLVIGWAADSGWKVDNTSDLARVYRLPGTHNRKTDPPVLASVQLAPPGFRQWYALEEIGQAVSSASRPAPADPGPNLPPEQRRQEQPRERSQQSQLFGGGQAPSDGPRAFTLAQAMIYVQPGLETLRQAQPGEINVRLNEAAIRLAHFGEDFWSREAAEGQLYAALETTAYDGATWKAQDTITSAYRALAERSDDPEYWRAELVPSSLAEVAAPPADAVEALLAEMVGPAELRNQPPQPYLIKGLINLDSETWLIGAPGSRKSFVALDMAACIAAGTPWQGRKVHQGPVVLIAAEGGGGLGGRIRAWETERGQEMHECVHILRRPVQSADLKAWMVLVEACRRIRPVLIIADTQARVTVGLKENDATDMGIFVDAVSMLRRATGACIMPVHHTGRTGGDARGSSALDGAQDTELKVVALAEPLSGELRTEKQKDLAEGAPIPLRFARHQVGVDEDGEPVTSLALRAADAWQASETQPEQPEPWEIGHAEVIVQLFKVLRDQGAEGGLTKAEARHSVVERFYGGQAKALTRSTWYSGWDRALAKESASGDRVMINLRGEKWTVDPVALAGMPAREQ